MSNIIEAIMGTNLNDSTSFIIFIFSGAAVSMAFDKGEQIETKQGLDKLIN